MIFARMRLATLAAVPLTLAVAFSSAPPGAAQHLDVKAIDAKATQDNASSGVSRPAAQVTLRLGHASTPSVAGSVPRALAATTTKTTFRVTYTGFTPAARTAFQRAVNIWASLINTTVPVTVKASFSPLGTGVLGSAGPNFVWRDFPGAPKANTWYPDAIANKRARQQKDPAPDIGARFNRNFKKWWFGAGPAPAGKIDFTAVVLHELGHGLGFAGAGRVSQGRGSVRLSSSPPLPLAYDRYTENAVGKALLTFPNQSAQLAAQLKSSNVFFDSPGVRKANRGKRARLYAPPAWQPGSSYSHLAEATYKQGNQNSLMTPVLNYGETVRGPGPITRAIFLNIGW